jgi:hypothetical protein
MMFFYEAQFLNLKNARQEDYHLAMLEFISKIDDTHSSL